MTIYRPFFHSAGYRTPSPEPVGTRGAWSARPRLCDPLWASMVVATLMAVAQGSCPTITVIIQSRVDAALG